MKTIIILSLFLFGIPSVYSQTETKMDFQGGFHQNSSIILNGNRAHFGMLSLDTTLLSDAWRHLFKAKKLTNIGIGFGAIANLSILLITPALLDGRPEDAGWAGLIGFPFATARFFISFAPPSKLKKANNYLLLYEDFTEGQVSFKETSRHLTIARRTAIAVPLLGLAGMIMIPAGIAGINNDRMSGKVLWFAGWGCALAGLTTTVISSIHISKAMDQLNKEKKGINLGLNSSGLGVGYRF